MKPTINKSNLKSMSNDCFFALLEQELADHFSVRFRVKGTSMEPLLRDNRDEVQLIAYKGQSLTPGNICLFKFNGRYILHRYLRQEGNRLCFQGDNVVTHYEYCTPNEVVGVVKTIYRDAKVFPGDTTEWKYLILLNRFKQRVRLVIAACIPRSIKNFIKRR